MIELRGKFETAKIFTDTVESEAIAQILELASQEYMKGSNIRIMPDVHSGKGCVIGTTFILTQDKVCPNLVGVDIGCGMHVTKIKGKDIDLPKLDKVIRQYIPSGRSVHKSLHEFGNFKPKIKDMENKIQKMFYYPKMEYSLMSIGSLGGGNHFIELNKNHNDEYYLVIHSGSRYLGKSIAEYYMNKAIKSYDQSYVSEKEKKDLVIKLKEENRREEIPEALRKIQKSKDVYSQALAYVSKEDFEHYMHDIAIVQEYANLNKEIMSNIIFDNMNWKKEDGFITMHNYIDTENRILRKGSVSARDGEILIIPMNMRDGSLVCRGKGNKDWNYSAPHGAGRLMSRSKAKETLKMEEFKESMKDIYTTSVHVSTIDEAPMAYKPMQSIVENIGDSVEILETIKPVYNFKADE